MKKFICDYILTPPAVFAAGIFTVLCLSSCGEPSASDISADYSVRPKAFKDCIIGKMSDGSQRIIAVRCPNSNTTTTYQTGGKSKTTHVVTVVEDVPAEEAVTEKPDTIVIDGVEYKKAE